MAATFVQSQAGTAATSGTTATVQPASSVGINNLLVVIVDILTVTANDLPVVNVTDDRGNRWKQAHSGTVPGALNAHDHSVDVWYCDLALGGTRPTVTATLQGFPPLDPTVDLLAGGGRMVCYFLEYANGAGGYEAVESAGVKSTTGTTVSAVTRDSCSANDLLVSAVIYNGTTSTAPATWTSRVNDTTAKYAVADKLDSGAAGAQTAAWTGLTSNTKGYSIIVAFKPGGIRASSAIRCVRTQYRLAKLFAATTPLGVARATFTAPANGNTLILYTAPFVGNNVVKVTDDDGNTWRELYDGGFDAVGQGENSLWIASNCQSADTTVTISVHLVQGQGSGLWNDTQWLLMEYIELPYGVDVITSGVKLTDGNTAAPTVSTQSATPATSTLVLGFIAGGVNNFAGIDNAAGWNTRFIDSGGEIGVVEKVTSTPAVQTSAWTYDTSQTVSHFVVALGLRTATTSVAVAQARVPFSAPSLPAYVGQRAETVEWELLDSDNNPVGILTPLDQSANIRHNVGSDIIRTLDDLHLTEADCGRLDMLTSRVRPVWIMDDLTRWELGVFLFSAADRHPRKRVGTSTRTMSMYDQNTVLLDKRRESFGMTRGQLVRNAILQLIEEAHITDYSVGATGAVTGDDLAWPAGTPRLTILRHLCALGALLRPYFNNHGTLIVRNSPDLDSAFPNVSYDTGPSSRIDVETIVTAQDLFDVPNIYLVSSSGGESEVSGYALIPASQPHSVQNIGREKVETVTVQGLADSNAAFAAASALAMQRLGDWYTYEFSAAPDPRHDTFDIVAVDGVQYREISWELRCQPGGPHTHSLRQAYSLVQSADDTAPSGVGRVTP